MAVNSWKRKLPDILQSYQVVFIHIINMEIHTKVYRPYWI